MKKAWVEVKVKRRTGSCLLNLSLNLPITLAGCVNSLLMKKNKQALKGEYPEHDASVRARFKGLLCARLAAALICVIPFLTGTQAFVGGISPYEAQFGLMQTVENIGV